MRRITGVIVLLALVLLAILAACGEEVSLPGTDASTAGLDSSVAEPPDADSPGLDAALAAHDAASPGLDAAMPPDAAMPADAAAAGLDASSCTNSCPAVGNKRCNGSTKIDTCTKDASGCRGWSTADCPAGQSCSVMGVAMCM